MTSSPSRRTFLAGTLGLLAAGAAGCGSASTSGASTSSAPTRSGPPSGGPGGGPAGGGTTSTAAAALAAEVRTAFEQHTFKDSQTGHSLPYNLFLPASYDASKKYPLVLYIADSSLVGQAVTAPLTQYGALIWASAAEQAEHESIVLVPEYPKIIIDDNSGHTVTDYVELTSRLLADVSSTYAVDPARVYGTGQSMGCMTVIYLAAKHPGLFAAELFVSGQWDVSVLGNLAKEKFFYIAAGGDAKASGGQKDVEGVLDKAGVSYGTATWDATWTDARLEAAAKKLLADGDTTNFATFKTGTVLTASGQSATAGAGGGEHMASFEPAYKIAALRDWLFAQRAA
jgi:predicted peptidase